MVPEAGEPQRAAGFERIVALWRHEALYATMRFLEAVSQGPEPGAAGDSRAVIACLGAGHLTGARVQPAGVLGVFPGSTGVAGPGDGG
jgi:hypothetical protein